MADEEKIEPEKREWPPWWDWELDPWTHVALLHGQEQIADLPDASR